eukprot:TRINITY_DN14699_c0_g1_i1.p1 TRINITY_DN14699_c0_g1~~TRINITY_DN14699_c0_g1_i1.p1  ORF type:complete len:100 (+),score=5.46 TRINITY_DN14699_c0_g1_i1:164-463(+)
MLPPIAPFIVELVVIGVVVGFSTEWLQMPSPPFCCILSSAALQHYAFVVVLRSCVSSAIVSVPPFFMLDLASHSSDPLSHALCGSPFVNRRQNFFNRSW